MSAPQAERRTQTFDVAKKVNALGYTRVVVIEPGFPENAMG